MCNTQEKRHFPVGDNTCRAGARPPGLLSKVNLHLVSKLHFLLYFQESCSFKRPKSASSLASISASENSHPHSPSPVPIKRRCSSKVAGSCNQGEFPKQPASETEIQFHTHQREGIQICDHFLLGNCPHGSICELHHTRYPYHWQLRRSDNKAWQSLSDSAQRHLENLYCNVNKSHANFLDK